MIIKPVEGGGIGIEIVKKEEDILNYYKINKFNCDTIVQEFIEGYTLCCNVL